MIYMQSSHCFLFHFVLFCFPPRVVFWVGTASSEAKGELELCVAPTTFFPAKRNVQSPRRSVLSAGEVPKHRRTVSLSLSLSFMVPLIFSDQASEGSKPWYWS